MRGQEGVEWPMTATMEGNDGKCEFGAGRPVW